VMPPIELNIFQRGKGDNGQWSRANCRN